MSNSRRLVDAIVKQINKSPIFNNASSAIGNATERAQSKLSNVQSFATEKYNTIVQQVNGATLIQDMKSTQVLPAISPLPKRLVDWWQWYQQLTGLDTVEIAKQHMILVQNELFKCQDERRTLMNQSHLVNDKLKEIYGELIQTRRDDPKYVQLTIMENKGLQEQIRITGQLNLLENTERDNFTKLATAIKEYHDAQAMNAQKYKYLSILASAFLAILSLGGSMIYNNRRIADVRRVIAEAQENNNSTFMKCFQSLKTELSAISTNSNENKFQNNPVILPNTEKEWPKTFGIIVAGAVALIVLIQQFSRS